MDLKATMLAAALSFSAAIPASAASMYNLQATSNIPLVTGFSAVFEDLDDDKLFSLNELKDFSGIAVAGTSSVEYYPHLVLVPVIPFISDGGDPSDPINSNSKNYWGFSFNGISTNNALSLVNFSYENSVVPLPAGLPLLLTGLAGFAGLRMRKKRAAQV